MEELVKVITKFPMDSTVLYKNKAIGTVIGYRRANGTGSIEVIFKHYKHLALGREGQFSVKSRSYLAAVPFHNSVGVK